MNLVRLAFAFALVFASLASTGAAFAQTPPPNDAAAQAARLKTAGDDAMAEKRYVEALDDYQQSYALVPNPAMHYNRGRVLQFLARYPEALDAILKFDAEAPPDLKARVPGLANLIVDLRGKVATLSIKTNAPSGRVLVNGVDMGPAPPTQPLRVNAGKTTVEVIADGFFPYRTQADLAGGQTTELVAQLRSKDAFGYLVVRSHVPEARVTVDGEGIGLVPAEAVLSPGSHPVRVDREGYSAADTQVVLARGERREIFLDPLKSKPITSKWWFWTGVGVVAVAVVTTIIVIAATTEKGPPSGTFSPGQLSF